jgi:hypothetical protein
LERSQSLWRDGLVTQQVLDHSIAEVGQNESRLRNARATLERLQRDHTLTSRNGSSSFRLRKRACPVRRASCRYGHWRRTWS